MQAGLPAVDCDPIKITEVFGNLIGNAIKFSSRHAARPRVEIGYRKIGATAIDILKAKLANERLGPTDNPAVTLIRGEWRDGASACIKPKKTAVCA